MKVIGIGNAIVDVICKVEENFLTNNKLTKSTMKLVDEREFKKLLSNLRIEEKPFGPWGTAISFWIHPCKSIFSTPKEFFCRSV